jgi:hypothetical protein
MGAKTSQEEAEQNGHRRILLYAVVLTEEHHFLLFAHVLHQSELGGLNHRKRTQVRFLLRLSSPLYGIVGNLQLEFFDGVAHIQVTANLVPHLRDSFIVARMGIHAEQLAVLQEQRVGCGKQGRRR